MTLLVHILQILTALAWVQPIVWRGDSVVRILRGQGGGMDPSWTVLCFTATPFIFGALRWTVWPDSMAAMQTAELVAWAGVYVLSIMSGLMAFWVVQSRGAGQ
jgi:hypothetical protein